MRLFFFVTTCFLLLNAELFSQENYIPGSVTLISGDTITGEIDYRNPVRTPDFIRFRKDSLSDVINYSPSNLLSFQAGLVRYVSKNLIIDASPYRTSATREIRPSSIQKQVFLQLLVNGTISLYKYQNERPHYFIETEDRIEELISSQYVVSIGGQLQVVKTNEHMYRRQLAELGYECKTESARKVKYRANELTKYISECNGGDVLTYIFEKAKPDYKHSFYIGGLKSSLNLKVNPNFPLSSIRSEILQNFESTYDASFSFVLGYYFKIIYPTGLRKSSLSFGLDVHNFDSQTSGEFYNFIYRENGISELQNISNMQLTFTMLSLKSWFSYKVKSNAVTPYFDFGASFSRLVRHSSKANVHTDFYETGTLGFDVPLETFPIIDEADEVQAFYDNKSLYTSGLGIIAGLGFQVYNFYVTSRVDVLFHNYNHGTQVNLSLLLGFQF